jgi:transcriptional antiterminator RfaH
MHLQRSGLSVDTRGNWYCIRSQPRHEHIAAANLRRNHELEVFNPRIRFKRATRRGPVWVTEPLFPRYLFARFELSVMLPKVQHAFGVAGVVRFGPFWPAVSDSVIRELLSVVGEEETRVIEDTLQAGGEVQILGGAFDGFRAIVTRVMPARNRVAVLLDFLGRQTVVELDRGAVTTDAEWCAVRGEYAAAV